MQLGLPDEDIARLGLKAPDKHKYTSSRCSGKSAPADEQEPGYHRRLMTLILNTFQNYSFHPDEVQQLLSVLASILHLGDVKFVEADNVRPKKDSS